MIMFDWNERRPGRSEAEIRDYWHIRKVNAQRIEKWAPDQVRRDEHVFRTIPCKAILHQGRASAALASSFST